MIRHRTLPALAAIALMLAACGGAPADDPSPTTAATPTAEPTTAASPSAEPTEEGPARETVRLEGFAFDTDELTIAAGTEVMFVNADAAPHTVTHGSDGAAVDSPIVDDDLQQNGTTLVTFEEPGTYQITCRIHPSMNMTVVVE